MTFDTRLEDAFDQGSEAPMDLPKPRVRIVGCGGAGGNSIDRLHRMGLTHGETLAVNTDARHLRGITADRKMLIGGAVTHGLGAGGHPELGLKAAENADEELRGHLKDTDLVFLTVGLGGGTGTSLAPHVARVAREAGALVVSIGTMPFATERGRSRHAHEGARLLRRHSDTTILLDNNRLLELVPHLPLEHAFAVMDHLVCELVRNVTDTVSVPDLINIDFADLRTVMRLGGASTILCGEGSPAEPERVVEATLASPLMDFALGDATGALVHVASGPNLSLRSLNAILEGLTNQMRPDAQVICGTRIARELEGTMRVMCIAAGGPVHEVLEAVA